jgi:hypothetical protein
VGVITERLQGVANEVAEVSDELLLVLLNQKWTDHQIIMTMIRDILMYMVKCFSIKQSITSYLHNFDNIGSYICESKA